MNFQIKEEQFKIKYSVNKIVFKDCGHYWPFAFIWINSTFISSYKDKTHS